MSVAKLGARADLVNLGDVEAGVYRSAFPTVANFSALDKLGIRTILNLRDFWPEDYVKYTKTRGIEFLDFSVKGNKRSPEDMDPDRVAQAVAMMIDARRHPVLLHCRSGKHRTGAVIGCLRKLENWEEKQIMAEYVRYSRPKQRELDEEYIRRFDCLRVLDYLPKEENLAEWAKPHVASLLRLRDAQQGKFLTPFEARERGDEDRDWRLGKVGNAMLGVGGYGIPPDLLGESPGEGEGDIDDGACGSMLEGKCAEFQSDLEEDSTVPATGDGGEEEGDTDEGVMVGLSEEERCEEEVHTHVPSRGGFDDDLASAAIDVEASPPSP